MSGERPDFSLFNGVIGRIEAGGTGDEAGLPAALAQATRTFVAGLGPDMPLVLTLAGPPITSATGDEFCEAEICASDFRGMYNQTEAVFGAALDSLKPGQLMGFGIALPSQLFPTRSGEGTPLVLTLRPVLVTLAITTFVPDPMKASIVAIRRIEKVSLP